MIPSGWLIRKLRTSLKAISRHKGGKISLIIAGTETFVVFFKNGCLTFSFSAESETVSPVFHGYEMSSSSSSSSMLKFLNVSYDDTIFSHLSFTIKFRPIEKK